MPKTFSREGPRFIYPEMTSSRSLARCGLVANALWPRLVVKADDQGRMAGDAGSVLVACFPKLLHLVSLADVEAGLAELAAVEMVLVYDAAGETHLQIREWWRYQDGMRRAYPSRSPAPDGWFDVLFGNEGQATTFAKALDAGHFVLKSGFWPSAPRGRGARKVPADRPQSAALRARAGSGPVRSGHIRSDPVISDQVTSGTAREPAPLTGTGQASPPVLTNGARLTGSGYSAFEVLTGKPPSDKVAAWIDDECARYGREAVVHAMYETPNPTARGWFNRVKDRLRGKAPADDEGPDFGTAEAPAHG